MKRLTAHLESYLKLSEQALAPLHTRFNAAVSQQAQTRHILTDAQSLAVALVEFDHYLQTSQFNFEEGLTAKYGDAWCLSEEMTAEAFMRNVAEGKPLLDLGVSPMHGQYSHSLQFIVLQHHLGAEQTAAFFEFIGKSEILPCERAMNRTWSLWDEFMDRPAPILIPNCERRSCQDALDFGEMTPVSLGCMDARSPEWLTTVLALSPEDSGIPVIRQAILDDVASRQENIHEDLFITGYEKELYKSLRTAPTNKAVAL